MAPYCAIPRDYLSDTPLLRAMGFLVSQHGQLGAIPLPLFWAFPPWRACEVEVRYPPSKGVSQRYLRDTLWKQGQTRAIPPSAILSRKGIARYGGVSRTGPLRYWLVFIWPRNELILQRFRLQQYLVDAEHGLLSSNRVISWTTLSWGISYTTLPSKFLILHPSKILK